MKDLVQILTYKVEFSNDEFSCPLKYYILPGGVQMETEWSFWEGNQGTFLQNTALATLSDSDFPKFFISFFLFNDGIHGTTSYKAFPLHVSGLEQWSREIW